MIVKLISRESSNYSGTERKVFWKKNRNNIGINRVYNATQFSAYNLDF